MDMQLRSFFNHLIASGKIKNYRAIFKMGAYDSIEMVDKHDYMRRSNYVRYCSIKAEVQHYLRTLGFLETSNLERYILSEHKINITIDFFYCKILPTLSSVFPYVTFDDSIKKLQIEAGAERRTVHFNDNKLTTVQEYELSLTERMDKSNHFQNIERQRKGY